MADVRKILIEIDAETGNVVGGIANVNKQLAGLGATARVTTKEVSKAAKAMQKDMAGSAGIAGAAATELGRTISDLPFGITAVTNNISQLGNMFALLVTSTKSVGGAFKALWSTLMGPVGLLVAFQALVAGIEFFAQSQRKANKEVLDFNTSIDAQIEGLEEVAKAFEQTNVEEAKRLDLLQRSKTLGSDVLEGYKQELLTRTEIAKLARLEAEAAKAKEQLEKNNAKRTEERKALEEDLIKIREREERLENRRENLRRQGFEEDQIAVETANQAKDIASDRRAIESDIADIKEKQRLEEEGIYRALEEAQKIREVAEQRLSAEKQLTEERFNLQSKILEIEKKALEESGVQVVEKQRENQQKIYKLTKARLDREKEEELANITDRKTIALIEEKYKLLFKSAALDFKTALEGIKFEPIEVEVKPVISGKDLIEGRDTDAQKWARKEVQKIGKAAEEGLEDYAESLGEKDWFIDTFGFSQEKLEKTAKSVQEGLDVAFGLIDAGFERELALEERKTIALNDQLKSRLANEKLTAEQRDAINQEIARNDAELIKKQNEIEKKRFQLNKAQAVSNAVVNTAVAVSKVLPNFPLAAAVGALGAAQVATIMAQTFVPKAMPTPNLTAQGGAAGGGLSPSFNVVGASQLDQLSAAVEMAMSKYPIKSYVVSSDVTTAQQLDRSIIQGASI